MHINKKELNTFDSDIDDKKNFAKFRLIRNYKEIGH